MVLNILLEGLGVTADRRMTDQDGKGLLAADNPPGVSRGAEHSRTRAKGAVVVMCPDAPGASPGLAARLGMGERGRWELRKCLHVLVIGLMVVSGLTRRCELSAQETSVGWTDEESRAAIALLRRECASCHGSEAQEGGLRLDSLASLSAGGEQGPVIDSENWEQSSLLRAIRFDDQVSGMPPEKPLSADAVSLLSRWIEAGMPWPESAEISESHDRIGDAFSDSRNPVRQVFGEERLDLWSLKPLNESPSPEVAPSSESRGPIDAWLVQKLNEQGLSFGESASKRNLLRRVSLDLLGLPPALEEVAEFESDGRPDAWERQIDRMLASPHLGAHLGRMWLDVVRYSDSNGFDWDEFRPQAWRYRDWVIDALNADLAYDRFVIDQLAGDEVAGDEIETPAERDSWVATGYLRMGPHDNAAPLFNEQDRSRNELMEDLTETTAAAFLGQTFSCCRCHDHKTDPLLQRDHFRLRAFFAGVTFADDRSLETQEEQAAREAIEASIAQELSEIQQREEELKQELDSEAKNRELVELEQRRAELESRRPKVLNGIVMTEVDDEIPATHLLYQGDHKAPREVVEPGWPSVFEPADYTAMADGQDPAIGRRRALADWVVSQDNVWTWRVIVNRIWAVAFGRGLVATANDFGVSGELPSHPELLDRLAIRLRDGDRSFKRALREMVVSTAYRQAGIEASSEAERQRQSLAAAIDPEVRLVWRRQPRRLTAEQVRDAVLAVGDALEHRLGGAPVWPELPAEILQANPAFLDDNETRTKGWYPSPIERQRVRAIYLVQKRTVRIPFMETFDLPENSVSCACRSSSIVPPQALTLLNGDLTRPGIEALANSVAWDTRAVDADFQAAAQINRLYQRVLQREPTEAEQVACLGFLQDRSLVELARVLVNLNEFAFVE